MGFLDWIDDVRRSKRFEKFCEPDVLSKYTFSVAGIRYARRDYYLRPYFRIDDSNNVLAVDKAIEDAKFDDYYLYPFDPAPFPSQNKSFPHLLVYGRFRDEYEYMVFHKTGNPYKITDIRTRDWGYYPFATYDDFLKNVNDLHDKRIGGNEVTCLIEHCQHNMLLRDINLDRVFWHESYHLLSRTKRTIPTLP